MASVTCHHFGKGQAVYQACRDSGSLKEQILEELIKQCGIRSNVAEGKLPKGITAHSRTDGETSYVFVENYSGTESATVRLAGEMTDMRTGGMTDVCELTPYGFGIFKYV